jgi:hypothetical protein
MAHGGKRPGAGRRPGSTTQKTREIADRATEEGITPLEFMLQVMRDESAERSERLDMAKAAAPYVHPRLSAVEAKIDAEVNGSVTKIERLIVDPQG